MAAVGINYDFQNCESRPIAILEEKILQFIANHGPESKVHEKIEPETEGNFTDCGRRENYLIEKAWQIISELRAAKARGAETFYWTWNPSH